jgi:hypothetical protein
MVKTGAATFESGPAAVERRSLSLREAFGCQGADGVRTAGWRGRALVGKMMVGGIARWLRVVVAPAGRLSEKL